MNAQDALTFGQRGLEVLLTVAAPMLLAALIVGLVVSVFQAATQINEATLSFIPKLIAILGVMAFGGPWMISVLVDYIRAVLLGLATSIG